MAGLSDALENAILDHIYRNVAYTPPTTVYVALFTVAPTDAGGGTEVSGNAYARQAITFAAAASGAIASNAAVNFPTATGSWGTIVAVGFFSASTGGTLLSWNTITSVSIASGEQFAIASGGATVTLD